MTASRQPSPRRFVPAPLAGGLLALGRARAIAAPSLAAGELVKNGLFARGAGENPEGWTHDGYAADGQATRFEWKVDAASQLGAIAITTTVSNDARWTQSVPVSPSTWYRVSGWVKTENVGPNAMGAYLSVMNTFDNSRDLRGTQGWQPVSLWVKTTGLETTLLVACRLGGYGSINTGTAYFTGISVEAAGLPPRGEPFVYGGTVDESSTRGPLVVQGIAVLVAIGIALLLWRYLLPPSASIPP